jgi:hypothetical protein
MTKDEEIDYWKNIALTYGWHLDYNIYLDEPDPETCGMNDERLQCTCGWEFHLHELLKWNKEKKRGK